MDVWFNQVSHCARVQFIFQGMYFPLIDRGVMNIFGGVWRTRSKGIGA